MPARTRSKSSDLAARGPWRSSAVRHGDSGRRGGRAAAAPAFSGPPRGRPPQRSVHLWHQHPLDMQAPWRPRTGPAPAGATAALHPTGEVCLPEDPGGGTAGGPGMRAQAPFAVATRRARGAGVDGSGPANHGRCPASVGRRTHARATCRVDCNARGAVLSVPRSATAAGASRTAGNDRGRSFRCAGRLGDRAVAASAAPGAPRGCRRHRAAGCPVPGAVRDC
jgi:hypothetical protein